MLPEKDHENERLPFTDPQMRELFASPLFTGCGGDSWQEMALPGAHQIRDHRYWVPLVMAYSGARPGEIAQLQTADVREHHGIWIMHITELGEGDKRTKTEGSMRVVPIHSELVRLGFVEHCQRMVKAGHKQVFPEVHIPETGQIIPEFSREMNRTYLTRIGLKTGREIVVYSLRHSFIDRLKREGISLEEIATLVGHDKPTMTGRYGVEKPGTLKRRAELVEAVRYS
jgi:integrase